MQPFHSQHRADRRRRVLIDESGDDGARAATVKPASRSRKAPPAYTDAAKQEHARRVTDLFPRTFLSLGLIFVAGAIAIGALVAAHIWLPTLEAWGSKEGFAALDLSARGSLASWVSSLLLGLASIASLVVWSVRRHKLDDYRGHYRWWFVAAGAWLLMSIDATTGLHEALRAVMMKLAPTSAGPLAGHGWWLGAWTLILLMTVTRLMLDMRSCPGALAPLALSMALWIAATVCRFVNLALPPAYLVAIVEASKLCGQLLLVEAVLLYARHVILHSQGLLPSREAKARKAKSKKEVSKASSESGSITRVDAAHASPPAPHHEKRSDLESAGSHSSAAAHSTTAHREEDDDYDDEDDRDEQRGSRKLSKADRKRMRKQKLEERDW